MAAKRSVATKTIRTKMANVSTGDLKDKLKDLRNALAEPSMAKRHVKYARKAAIIRAELTARGSPTKAASATSRSSAAKKAWSTRRKNG